MQCTAADCNLSSVVLVTAEQIDPRGSKSFGPMLPMRAVACALLVGAVGAAVAETYDVVVYDATSGGVMAAVAAGRHGSKTALLCASWPACFPEGGHIIGGMSAGGLGQTDIGGHTEIIGGLAREFYKRNRQHYGQAQHVASAESGAENCRLPTQGCNATYNLEPHVAQSIFAAMLNEAGVKVFFAAQVQTVTKQGSAVTTIALTDGSVYHANVFIDASYEGDLFSRAGASFIVGRESNATFQESLAGRAVGPHSNQFNLAVNPFDASGQMLPLLSPPDRTPVGEGDKKVQSYNFRLCVTKNATNMLPFPKPVGYDPATWELLRRYAKACFPDGTTEAQRGCQFGFPSCNTAPVPGGKYDMNNCGGMSSDFIGQSWNYPEANYTERQDIWRGHRDYQMGLLFTMANDPAMPAAVRNGMKPWGLCADEFAASQGWAPALYVRAARRLVGERIFNQNTPKELDAAGDIGEESIGLGNYNFDSHNAQRMACKSSADCMGAQPGWDGPFAWDEGDVQIAPGVYQIPRWVMQPKREQVSNLLVVAAPSASHIGMSTLRMEPQFMIIGHAAGVLAHLAASSGAGAIHAVPNATLHQMLLADQQLTSSDGILPPPPPPPSPLPKLQPDQWLAIGTFFSFSTSGGVTTMVVSSVPRGQHSTYLKKSETNSRDLPPSMLKEVSKGEKFVLATKPSNVGNQYWLVTLKT